MFINLPGPWHYYRIVDRFETHINVTDAVTVMVCSSDDIEDPAACIVVVGWQYAVVDDLLYEVKDVDIEPIGMVLTLRGIPDYQI